jgi:hypothetical protein
MPDLKKLGGTGAAIYVITAIGSYLLPTPHMYQSIYVYFYGPAGALAGYGVAGFVVLHAKRWQTVTLALVAAIALMGAVVCGSVYCELYSTNRSPTFFERLVHVILYALAFTFFFFIVRWAGFLLKLGDDPTEKEDEE